MDDAARTVTVKGVEIGGPELVVMAGPCSIESREQIFECAEVVAASGSRFLRGGAFKTRTDPRSFQGLGVEGYRLLREAADENGLCTISEVLAIEEIDAALPYLDMIQIGSRNMQNVPLLRALGRSGVPVLLKRGFGCTIDEWLHAAEYVLCEGNEQVVLCERGIRTFETATRFTLDVAAVPVVKQKLGVPVVVDPSHAAGRRDLVPCLAATGIAAGADGLLVETHRDPSKALSDGPQAIVLSEFGGLMDQWRRLAEAMGRTLPVAAPVALRV